MPGFIIDLDGTLYAGDRPIAYAAEFIERIRQEGHPYLYVTNNSSRHPQAVAAHLQTVSGIQATAAEVFTSSQATARYIADRKPNASIFVIGEEGLRVALTAVGLRLWEQGNASIPDYVVQGIDREFNYDKLTEAVRHIAAGACFIATNPDHLLPSTDGLRPGAGAIGAAIATASQTEPIVIGKPSPIILQYAIEQLGMPAADIWVIGDNLRTDIGGGKAVGCPTALVLTGLLTQEQAHRQIVETGIQPDRICKHLMEFFN